MLLDYRSIFEIFTLAFRKKKLKKKENGAARKRMTGKSIALFGTLIFKTMMDMQIQI